MAKLCKDCEYFKIVSEPFGYEWGQAVCKKYDLTIDFRNHGKFKTLSCNDRQQEALEQEPCEDCISRVAVRQALGRYIQKAQSNGTKDDLISFEELVIKSLPSVQPKKKPKADTWSIEEVAKVFERYGLLEREREPETEWIPATCPPKENGRYLVTIHYSTHDLMEIMGYANNLYEVDEYDFADRKRPGWYSYDSEYGFFEHDNVVAWRKLPEAYKESEVSE